MFLCWILFGFYAHIFGIYCIIKTFIVQIIAYLVFIVIEDTRVCVLCSANQLSSTFNCQNGWNLLTHFDRAYFSSITTWANVSQYEFTAPLEGIRAYFSPNSNLVTEINTKPIVKIAAVTIFQHRSGIRHGSIFTISSCRQGDPLIMPFHRWHQPIVLPSPISMAINYRKRTHGYFRMRARWE